MFKMKRNIIIIILISVALVTGGFKSTLVYATSTNKSIIENVKDRSISLFDGIMDTFEKAKPFAKKYINQFQKNTNKSLDISLDKTLDGLKRDEDIFNNLKESKFDGDTRSFNEKINDMLDSFLEQDKDNVTIDEAENIEYPSFTEDEFLESGLRIVKNKDDISQDEIDSVKGTTNSIIDKVFGFFERIQMEIVRLLSS